MCTGAEVALLVSAGVSAGSAIYSGEQQKDLADYQARQARADADAQKQAADIQAEKLRERAKRVAASARAALAASGVSLDSETAVAINKDIIERGEMDASTAQFDGLDAASRLRSQAQALRMQGNSARVAGYAQAGSAIVSYGNTAGWYGSGSTATKTAGTV